MQLRSDANMDFTRYGDNILRWVDRFKFIFLSEISSGSVNPKNHSNWSIDHIVKKTCTKWMFSGTHSGDFKVVTCSMSQRNIRLLFSE